MKEFKQGEFIIATKNIISTDGYRITKNSKYQILYVDKRFDDYTIRDDTRQEFVFDDDCFDSNSEYYCFMSLKEFRKQKIESIL